MSVEAITNNSFFVRLVEKSTKLGRMMPFVVAFSTLVSFGCSREHYRLRADRDVYAVQRERQLDSRWRLPDRPVEPAVDSRLADPSCPDRFAIPPDDQAARGFQVTARRPWSSHEFHEWEKRGRASTVEQVAWRERLPTNGRGAVVISRESAVRLGMTHSREYQTEVENLYSIALGLTLARFEFELQGASRHGVAYTRSGSTSNRLEQLQIDNGVSIRRNLMTGGQLLADLANVVVLEWNGSSINAVGSTLALAFTQPLLRNAFARIRTQRLSEVERAVLYQTRDFARFRRSFYVDLTASDGYYGLLTQTQALRNARSVLDKLERSRQEHEALLKAGLIPLFQRDQVTQQVQQNQFALIAAETSLQSSLDRFKVRLGLPPELKVEIDESPLDRFELVDKDLDALRAEAEARYLKSLGRESSDRTAVDETVAYLKELVPKIEKALERSEARWKAWRRSLDDRRRKRGETVAKVDLDELLEEACADELDEKDKADGPGNGEADAKLKKAEPKTNSKSIADGAKNESPKSSDMSNADRVASDVREVAKNDGISKIYQAADERLDKATPFEKSERDLSDRVAANLCRVKRRLATLKMRLKRGDFDDEKKSPEKSPVAKSAENPATKPELKSAVKPTSKDSTLRNVSATATQDAGLTNKNIAIDSTTRRFQLVRSTLGRDVRSLLADLYVSQTQANVYLIELTEVELTETEAMRSAMENRLDLQNAQARVTDAWREVEVAADQLQADLSVRYDGTIATDPDKKEPFRFDASASRHRFGLQLDTPINRRAERNAYRLSQIAYQRSRRDYMATKDAIESQIRLDLRTLTLAKRQFEISREQLITASRQLEEAEINVRSNLSSENSDSSLTLYLLQALQSLLSARNGIIENWVVYETARMALARDLDLMDIDDVGVWSNEATQLKSIGANGPPPRFGDDRRLPSPEVDGDPTGPTDKSDERLGPMPQASIDRGSLPTDESSSAKPTFPNVESRGRLTIRRGDRPPRADVARVVPAKVAQSKVVTAKVPFTAPSSNSPLSPAPEAPNRSSTTSVQLPSTIKATDDRVKKSLETSADAGSASKSDELGSLFESGGHPSPVRPPIALPKPTMAKGTASSEAPGTSKDLMIRSVGFIESDSPNLTADDDSPTPLIRPAIPDRRSNAPTKNRESNNERTEATKRRSTFDADERRRSRLGIPRVTRFESDDDE